MKAIITIITTIFILASTLPALAGNEVSRAKDFYDMGRKGDAIRVLENHLDIEPKDFKAYWLLATWHMDSGNYESAAKNYRFALKLKPRKKSKVIDCYQSEFKSNFANGQIRRAKEAGKILITFSPKFRTQAYQQFFDKALKSTGNNQVELLDASLVFASTHRERSNVGKMYCKLALDSGNNDHYLFYEASKILGSKLVESTKPYTETIVVFERTYGDADTDDKGRIRIVKFSEVDVRKGDVIFISGNVPEGAESVYRARGKEWSEVPRKHPMRLSCDKKAPGKDKFESVWIDSGKGVTVTVQVKRKKEIKANYKALEII